MGCLWGLRCLWFVAAEALVNEQRSAVSLESAILIYKTSFGADSKHLDERVVKVCARRRQSISMPENFSAPMRKLLDRDECEERTL